MSGPLESRESANYMIVMLLIMRTTRICTMSNPPHPGRIVAEQIEYLGISIREFAQNIGVAPSTVSRIIKGTSPITAKMAIRLSATLPGPAPETWLALQSDYDVWHAAQTINTSSIKRYEIPEHRISV